jgi:hypothetical protein
MSFTVLPVVVLASAVAQSGTITFSYPAGKTRGDFVGAGRHLMTALQATYRSPVDFTVALNATTVVVTWQRSSSLPAGTQVRLQLDEAGEYPHQQDPAALEAIPNVNGTTSVEIDLGTPIATSTTAIRAAAALAANTNALTSTYVNEVPRNVTINSSASETLTFVVRGFDVFGNAMREDLAMSAATAVVGAKAFARVTDVRTTGTPSGNISVGVGSVLGSNVHIPSAGHVVRALVNNATEGTAGTVTAGLSPLSAATASNADVRGTYTPHSSLVPDGTRAYKLLALIPDPTFRGVPQFSA